MKCTKCYGEIEGDVIYLEQSPKGRYYKQDKFPQNERSLGIYPFGERCAEFPNSESIGMWKAILHTEEKLICRKYND